MVTTIQIDSAIRERLKRYGHAGMTYDDILQQMMDRWDEDEFAREMRARADHLDATNGWVSLD